MVVSIQNPQYRLRLRNYGTFFGLLGQKSDLDPFCTKPFHYVIISIVLEAYSVDE